MAKRRIKKPPKGRWIREVKDVKGDGGDVWDSGLKIVSPVVKIPHSLLAVCNTLQEKVGEYEFSILVKGEWTKRGYILSEEYIIPKQEVGYASVDYLEDLGKRKADGFNVVIHSHPFKSSSFSGEDDEYINSNFDCSILFSISSFTCAVLNISVGEGIKLQLEPSLEFFSPSCEEDMSIENIKKKRYAIRRRRGYDFMLMQEGYV